MPVTIEEKFDSRESFTGEGASVELTYVIRGTDSDIQAKASLEGAAPVTYDGLTRQGCHIEPVGPQLWNGVARYVQVQYTLPEIGESSLGFDTGGGTQHITQSFSTVSKHAPPGKTAPDFKGAVGVTHDNVEGVDIAIPIYNFSETHYLNDSAVTPAYRGTLFSLTGKVNNAAFKGLAAGECLFLGAGGSRRGEDDWEIRFSFAASPNKTNLTVGDITGIDKKGWEYMWVRYADAEDSEAKAIVKKPAAAYIEKVYEQGDFSQLGIGT